MGRRISYVEKARATLQVLRTSPFKSNPNDPIERLALAFRDSALNQCIPSWNEMREHEFFDTK